jgi:protein TonB
MSIERFCVDDSSKAPWPTTQPVICPSVPAEFIVETDGSISHIQVIKGIGGGCDEAAVDAVESSTAKWVPGKSAGVAVRQVIVLPITFKLAGAEKNLSVETESPKNTINEIVVVAYKEN